MATYQPGVTDYISQIQPTEPNLAFDAQILQTKQTKFDANHQKISELYGSILNSSMSRNENIAARDQFVKNINTDIVKMAGMDFSLDENVDAAANVFQAIYNNNHIVKDMVWTKNFQNEKSRGDALRNCVDPDKCGGQAWDQGDQYMEYKLKEFKDASNDESLGFENVEYIPYTNMMDKAMKYAKDNKLEISSDQLIGNYMVTTKNGPQAYGPLAELFTNLYANDPKLLKQYEAQAYVTRKNNVGSIMSETGLDENAATSEYYRRQGTVQQEKINSILEQSNADEEYISGRISEIEEKIKAGKVAKESNLAKEYNALQQLLPGAQQASQYIKLAKMTAEKANDNTYIRNVASQLDARDAAIFMHEDITGAAKSIADNTMTQKKEADEFAKLSVKHQYDVMMEGIKQTNRIALEQQKAITKNDPTNPFTSGGKDGKGNKEANKIAAKTVSGYINDSYDGPDPSLKSTYVSDAIKKVETQIEEFSGRPIDLATLKKRKAILQAKETERKLRGKVAYLDNSGIKPITGTSWGALYQQDKLANKRTADDYNSNNINKGYSKSVGEIYNNLKGIARPEVTPEQAEDALNKNNGKRSAKGADLDVNPVAKKKAVEVIKQSNLPLPKVTTEKINAGDSKTIAINTNKVVNAEKKKLVATKPVTKEMIQFVADSHANPSVQKAYKELSKKPIEKLSATEKKNIAAKYEKLNKEKSFEMTGAQTVSNQSVASAYNQHASFLNSDLGSKTKVVNKAYIESLDKNSAEYKLIKRQALTYIQKTAPEAGAYKVGYNKSFEDTRRAQFEKESGVKSKGNGKSYNIAGTTYKSDDISDWGLMNLVENNSGFSQTLYKYNVKKKASSTTNNPKFKESLKSIEVQNALDGIMDIEEDITNHVMLKKEAHTRILGKMNESSDDYEFPFQKDVLKNGFLMPKDEFIRKNVNLGRDRDDVIEEYQTYTLKYHEGLNLTLKQNKNLSGVGPTTYNVYESNSVHMYADKAPATIDAKDFLTNFKESGTQDKALYVDGKLITDRTEIQKYTSELERSKNFYNLSYQLSGVSEISTDTEKSDMSVVSDMASRDEFGQKDEKSAAVIKKAKQDVKTGAQDWEGLSFYNTKTKQKITFTSNPNKNSSPMYDARVQTPKDRSLQQTGKTVLFRGNDLTDSRPIIVKKDANGELKFEGVVHYDGRLVKINEFLYNSDKDYRESLNSYDDAKGFLNKVFELIEEEEK